MKEQSPRHESMAQTARPGTWSRPLAGFSKYTSFYASMWLVFLIPPFAALIASGQPLGLKLYGVTLAIVFGIFYGFAFGSHSYYPRGWSVNQRFWSAFAVLLVIALAMYPALGLGVVCFTPYLVAFVSFLRPIPTIFRLVPFIIAVSSVGGIVLGFATPSSDTFTVESGAWLLMWTLATPLFIAALGVLNQREDSRRKLASELERSLEREKMATDVHDLLGHSLTIIKLKAEVAARYVDRDPARAAEEMRSVADIAKHSLEEVRATVTNTLSRDITTEISRARDALETAGVECTVVASSIVADPKLFAWVLREAVTNIVRHSGASACTITVEGNRLVVCDNGCGIAVAESELSRSEVAGNGLRGMRRRAEAAGAELAITTPDGGGTAVTVSVPVGRVTSPTAPTTQTGHRGDQP
ncbi:sensor histidine kinase [Corynebacterium falsenii]